MYLHKLHLLNYRNYEDAKIEFNPKINVLLGPNGSGKTNLLDAIYYLSFTKSAFQSSDQVNTRITADGFFLSGSFDINGHINEVSVGYQLGGRKVFRNNGREYQKFSDHIGKYPVVLMAPDDVDLIRGGPEGRRQFFDSLISQIDKTYLENLIQYSFTLRQRNGLLKLFSEGGKIDYDALESYDVVLDRLGKQLYQKRKSFVIDFTPTFTSFFNSLVEDEEITGVNYESDLNTMSFLDGALHGRSRDFSQQRTSFGVHKDDYRFQLGNVEIKRYGSQGQHKSFVIALKLAQWQMLKTSKGFNPILLLDDIFDKLDNFRIHNLLELIRDFGQLFITDARPDWTAGLMKNLTSEADVFHVRDGQLTKRV
jgi:DNA replication and repair protein RecF